MSTTENHNAMVSKLWHYGFQYCYREVQLDITPEMEVLYMLFERCHTKIRKISLKQTVREIHQFPE